VALSISLALICIAYAMGVVRVSRQTKGSGRPPMTRMSAMFGGFLVIELALASPLDELADHLLAAHMVQHLLLMLIAAPLLVFGRPMPYLVWFLPLPLRKWVAYLWNRAGVSRLMRFVGKPAVCWGAFCAVVLLWHVPAIYRWAMGGELRHASMHLTFLGSGLLFWSVVLDAGGARSLNHASCALYVFSAALVTGLPGAHITFARRPLYMFTTSPPHPGGLTALADQQLAGLIMWIPMDLILFGVALALLAAALGPRRVGGRIVVLPRIVA
jgi:cytochrome c oxidase assembly factor CtaG